MLALIALIAYYRSIVNHYLKNTLENEISISDPVPVSETSESKKLNKNVSANLVWWDQDRGFTSISKNYDFINSISPFWYKLESNGTISKFTGAEDKEIIAFLSSKDISISPIISNEFEKEPLSSMLKDSNKRSSHLEDILAIAQDYPGISINYENLEAEDKDSFSEFIKLLSEQLHKRNKKLTVHLHAKTEEPGTWNGPQSQDWEKLGEYCDKLKIMAYDYHWSTSEPGAISPPEWV